jgi:C4-dicarboxylate-specific signal transduction histidine kinase
MAHVGRSVGVVIVGWGSGFLVAVAWGATRANNPRLASTLSWWAIAGMVVTGLLLISIALSDRAERRRVARQEQRQISTAATDTSATAAATVSEGRAAARIAELEARLAREQEELDAAVSSLAAAELAATGHVSPGTADAVPDPVAAVLEPVLRQEVVETVAQLMARTGPGQSAVLAEEVEALLEKVR